ncbi:MAG TPA: hypothetical protein VEM39_11955 [Myxococcaceae bacterium]|nr:hypothetical protein [Myxococcaceae bacterium]
MRRTAELLILSTALLIPACHRWQQIRGTPVLPTSIGEVRAVATPDDQTQVTLTVYNLPKPQFVSSDATAYLVWVRPNEASGQPQRLGQLTVDGDAGNLQAVTPLHEFELVVTAQSPTDSSIQGDRVLTGQVKRE